MRPSSCGWAPASIRRARPRPSAASVTTREPRSWRRISVPPPRSCWRAWPPADRPRAPASLTPRPRRPPRRALRADGGQAGEPRRAHRTANMSGRLTLARPKGRLLDGALGLLRGLGVDGIDADSRRLIFTDPARGLRLLFLKPADVPAYVTYGAADLGLVGKAILLEQEPDGYEPPDLGFGV